MTTNRQATLCLKKEKQKETKDSNLSHNNNVEVLELLRMMMMSHNNNLEVL